VRFVTIGTQNHEAILRSRRLNFRCRTHPRWRGASSPDLPNSRQNVLLRGRRGFRAAARIRSAPGLLAVAKRFHGLPLPAARGRDRVVPSAQRDIHGGRTRPAIWTAVVVDKMGVRHRLCAAGALLLVLQPNYWSHVCGPLRSRILAWSHSGVLALLTGLSGATKSTEDSTARALVTSVTALSRSTKRKPLSDAEGDAPGGIRTPDQRLRRPPLFL
jgi:hypothetical protein